MLMRCLADAPRVAEVAVRTTVAAIAGALLATLGMAVVQTRMSTQAPSPAATSAAWSGLPAQAQPVGLSTSGLAAAAPVAPAVMRCAPGQQAVLQQAIVDGRVVTSADCAWDTTAAAGYGGDGTGARLMPATDIVEYQPRARPVRYLQEEPVRRRVVRTAPKRSWQKSALVIGGSAGAGAGIGALAGGKKGALIGAAIGGGAGSIFEAFKRR
jgi:hypothetical protein